MITHNCKKKKKPPKSEYNYNIQSWNKDYCVWKNHPANYFMKKEMGRQSWGISTKSFSSLHSIKISTSTPKGGESTWERKGMESVLKITKKFRELWVLRDPCKYHYSSQSHCFNKTAQPGLWELPRKHTAKRHPKEHTNTHRGLSQPLPWHLKVQVSCH